MFINNPDTQADALGDLLDLVKKAYRIMKPFISALLHSLLVTTILFGIPLLHIWLCYPEIFSIPGKLEKFIVIFIISTVMGAIGYYIGSNEKKDKK